MKNQYKWSCNSGVFEIAGIQGIRSETHGEVGAVWKQLRADLGISVGFGLAVNELEKGGSIELMVLTDSVEVNGFVNTKREKMERNTGQEYTKQG